MSKLFSTLSVVLLLVALLLAGCGSDDGGGGATATGPSNQGATEENQVNGVIKTAFIARDPSKCTDLETAHYVQQVYFGMNVANSIAICHLASPALSADTVTVSKLEINGDK